MTERTKKALAVLVVSYGFLLFGSWLCFPALGWRGVIGVLVMMIGNNAGIMYRMHESPRSLRLQSHGLP